MLPLIEVAPSSRPRPPSALRTQACKANGHIPSFSTRALDGGLITPELIHGNTVPLQYDITARQITLHDCAVFRQVPAIAG